MRSQAAMLISSVKGCLVAVALCWFATGSALKPAIGQGIHIEIGERSNQYTQHQAVRRAIRRSMTVHADDTTLAEFANGLAKELGVPIDLDLAALDAEALNGSTPIRVDLQNQPFSCALRPLDLTYVIAHGRVLITTKNGCRSFDNVEVFDVSRLVDSPTRMAAATVGDFDPLSVPLVRAMIDSVAVDSWSVVGGPGRIHVLFLGDRTLLVVTNLDHALEEVDSYLDFLHQQLDQRPKATKVGQVESALAAGPVAREAEKVTRYYSLTLPEDVELEEVVDLLPCLVSQGEWETEKGAVCRRLGNRLVVRHNLDVLLQVEVELAKAGLLKNHPLQHEQEIPNGGIFLGR